MNQPAPPLGIKPRSIHDEERAQALLSAISARLDHCGISSLSATVHDWLDELRDLLERYQQ